MQWEHEPQMSVHSFFEFSQTFRGNRTSTFQDFYFSRIANLWNNILNDVRQAESIDSFKHEL